MSDTPARGLSRFRSVRVRLLAIALLPMLVVMPIFIGITLYNWVDRFDRLLIAKVNGELTIARQYMSSLLENRSAEVRALSESAVLAEALSDGDPAALATLLDGRRERLGLDFLYLWQPEALRAASPPGARLADPRKWPVVQAALAGEQAAVIDLFSAADLAAIDPALAARARLDLVPTEAAVPTERTEETRGMVMHVAAPAAGGGVLVGGVLLNRNLDFIDTINDLVYPAASLTEGSQGTATLFLEDVRVSTNVRLFEDVRALGTRVSAVVRQAVLDEGTTWLDRAFVVNDWYISAYQPIEDSFGNRIGMLYVGFLDTPFQDAKRRTLYIIVAAFLLVVALSVPIFLRWARGIFKPLERMNRTIARVEAGDLGARTGAPPAPDEIGRVAAAFDDLLEQIQERDRRLNDRVAERTRELEEANRRLEATTKQLVVSEKLAAIGEITAGIAHEINNPVAVIQGNLDVIREEIGQPDPDVETEFALIYEQVHAINILVGKLLQFARPEEYAGVVDRHPPEEVIRDCLPLVQHLMNKVSIEVTLQMDATHTVAMNRTELQQVLINLIVNAIHAMPEGGRLTLSTADAAQDGEPGVRITVADTGAGMSEAVLARVFDPFFTTKRSEGTGLGLSISRDLVTRTGGTITVESTEGAGTVFTIWLPSGEAGDAPEDTGAGS
ncbi:Sporulation kinase E [Pseudoruegeria aquimaris]|uniref:histidine kinase n=1 Tax=Pseudoruegeria aquimaris TaxID=393663 RepID=A0A1Y5S250_9RHOB|nr:cache domain-containing protein [Pseudoruegeria aquimaris]SLN30364.1 Sporulation kinase E [Pseudoruegeria aquimaris]